VTECVGFLAEADVDFPQSDYPHSYGLLPVSPKGPRAYHVHVCTQMGWAAFTPVTTVRQDLQKDPVPESRTFTVRHNAVNGAVGV